MLQLNKPVVLIFIDWYLPAYKAGGPVRSIVNLVENLKHDFVFKIVTSDRDLGENSPLPDIKTDEWQQKNGYRIIYLSPQNRPQKIKRILHREKFDKVYLNSMFSKDFSLLPLFFLKQMRKSSKVVLAPRGMLGHGALARKSTKKQVFLKAAKAVKLFSNITWHATSEEEKQNISDYFGQQAKIIEARNYSIVPPELSFIDKQKNQLRLVFLSRILPIKNLDFALSVLQKFDKKDITFDIYGTVEDSQYWQQIQQQIKTLQHVKVRYCGKLQPQEVLPALAQYHFLFLPTKHENFGHVIAEALAAGCGLIISDQTPWRNLQEHKAGWDISLQNPEAFVQAVKTAYALSNDEYKTVRQNAYEWFVSYTNNENLKKQYVTMFCFNQ